MRIGEIARLAGSSPKGVRLYEAKGLLGQVSRDGGVPTLWRAGPGPCAAD
jgi:DNA-binding transcriptional MerR regulator